MAAEVNFARSFLSMLDSRPIKISGEHVEDPRNYPSRSAYILPKMPRPLSKRRPARAAPSQGPSVSVVVKSLRSGAAPPVDVRLTPADGLAASLLDVKAAVAAETGLAADRLRLLHKRKPVPDSKILKDLLPSPPSPGTDETAEIPAVVVELSVMVMGGGSGGGGGGGGAAATGAGADTKEVVAQGGAASGGEVLGTAEFWDDLRGFLLQRVRDEKLAAELSDTFQAAWKAAKR